MFTPRIYFPHPLQIDKIITLDKATSHHLSNVLRLRTGETVILFNGEGGEFQAKLLHTTKLAEIQILSYSEITKESSLQLHLGQGLARGDRMDFVIQKATELGVTSITPLFTQKCGVKLDEAKMPKRLQHWQNIAISAAEQCGRTILPIIHTPLPLNEWIKQAFDGFSLMFEPGSSHYLRDLKPSASFRLSIGPESGFEQQEINLMKTQNFISSSLGPRILRTETAGIAALSLLQGLFGDL